MAWVPIYTWNTGTGGVGGGSITVADLVSTIHAHRGNQWLTGKGIPPTSLGREQDLYFDETGRDVYQKRTAFFGFPPGWVLITKLGGLKGERGQDGKPGLPGPPGLAGTGTGGGGTTYTGTLPIVVSGSAISINPATATDPGSLSAADKAKLDAATELNTPSTLVIRDAGGSFAANDVTLAGTLTAPIIAATFIGATTANLTTINADTINFTGNISGNLTSSVITSYSIAGIHVAVTSDPVAATDAVNLGYLQAYVPTVIGSLPAGPVGPPGARGQDANQWLTGKAVPAANQGREKDLYFQTGGKIYQKVSPFLGYPPSWAQIASIIGPAGPKGDRGDTGFPGLPGAAGRQGVDGATGATGSTGAPGNDGATGAAGANGTNGTDGRSAFSNVGPKGQDGATWFKGIGAPSRLLGNVNDHYYDTSNGDVWSKGRPFDLAVPAWVKVLNLTGPAGPRGFQGITGPQGIPGPAAGTGPVRTFLSVYMASNMSALVDSTATTVHLDTVVSDYLSEFNATTFTFTPKVSGDYIVTFVCTLGGVVTRFNAHVWIGTSSELARFADGSLTLAGGSQILTLTSGTGYTFRVASVGSTPTPQGGSNFTFLKIKAFP